jgi:hypothetical protein
MQSIDYDVADFTRDLEKKLAYNRKNFPNNMPDWYAGLLDIYTLILGKLPLYKDHQWMIFWQEHIRRIYAKQSHQFPQMIQIYSHLPKYVATLQKLNTTLDKLISELSQ